MPLFTAYVHRIGKDVTVKAAGGRDAEEKLIARYGGAGYYIRPTRQLPIEISTRKYELSHGRKPSGYGAWGFIAMHGPKEIETFFAPAMPLRDATVWAKAYLRGLHPDCHDLEVAP